MTAYPANYPHWARQAADQAQTTLPTFMNISSADFMADWMSNNNPLPANTYVNLYGNANKRVKVLNYQSLARLLREGSVIVA